MTQIFIRCFVQICRHASSVLSHRIQTKILNRMSGSLCYTSNIMFATVRKNRLVLQYWKPHFSSQTIFCNCKISGSSRCILLYNWFSLLRHSCLGFLTVFQYIFEKILPSLIWWPHHGSWCYIQKTHLLCLCLVGRKHLWCNILLHSHVPLGWPHILPKCHNIHTCKKHNPKVMHGALLASKLDLSPDSPEMALLDVAVSDMKYSSPGTNKPAQALWFRKATMWPCECADDKLCTCNSLKWHTILS